MSTLWQLNMAQVVNKVVPHVNVIRMGIMDSENIDQHQMDQLVAEFKSQEYTVARQSDRYWLIVKNETDDRGIIVRIVGESGLYILRWWEE